jgi:hypothetical protein
MGAGEQPIGCHITTLVEGLMSLLFIFKIFSTHGTEIVKCLLPTILMPLSFFYFIKNC